MPRRISHQDHVPVCAGVIQWVLRLGAPAPSGRTQENVWFRERIRALHADHDGVLGSTWIWEDLRYAGERCGHHRVTQLMRRAGLQGMLQQQ